MTDAKRTVAALRQLGAHMPRMKRGQSDAFVADNTHADEVDLTVWPTAKQLVDRCRDFLSEMEDM
jgi:hypothetical protein